MTRLDATGAAPSSAVAIARAVSKRSAGSFISARARTASRSAAIGARRRLGGSIGSSTILLAGLFLAALGASSGVASDIESGRAATVLSKPAGRGTFLAGRFLGLALALALAVFLFKTAPTLSPALLLGTFVSTTALAIVGGMALSRGITRHPPLEILRRVG